ncbi:MAG: N-acetylmuramoyl-L-alanine amidase, partial [Defluviitaleaceae bacterium]|nr:N-acetylmuramoyl-L-alanine amidase [Defluviitaleaceae bacterium]
MEAIMQLNGLTSTLIHPGQVLRIPTSTPPSGFNYTVVAGDNLWSIAQRFGTTMEAIMQLNGLTSTLIHPGQVLRIPSGSGGTTPPPPQRRYTIVIDPGHGGSDPGAVANGRREADDVLRLSLAVQRLLEAQGQRVIMTRTTDTFVPLAERSAISNRNNADLFVSIHRNSNTNPSINGVDNFVFTTAPQ